MNRYDYLSQYRIKDTKRTVNRKPQLIQHDELLNDVYVFVDTEPLNKQTFFIREINERIREEQTNE